MTIEITNQVRIQNHKDYWYTVEDTNLDIGGPGCTISYWEFMGETGDKRIQHFCMDEEQALAIADTIYKFLKRN